MCVCVSYVIDVISTAYLGKAPPSSNPISPVDCGALVSDVESSREREGTAFVRENGAQNSVTRSVSTAIPPPAACARKVQRVHTHSFPFTMISARIEPSSIAGALLTRYPRALGSGVVFDNKVVFAGGISDRVPLSPAAALRIELPSLTSSPTDYAGFAIGSDGASCDGINRVGGALHVVTAKAGSSPFLVSLGSSAAERPVFQSCKALPRTGTREGLLSMHALDTARGMWKPVESTIKTIAQLEPASSGTPPAAPTARIGFASVAGKLSTQRIFIFGGVTVDGPVNDVGYVSWSSSDTPYAATWKLFFTRDKEKGGSAWPCARSFSSIAFDERSFQLIILGGMDAAGQRLNDVHICSFANDRARWRGLKLSGAVPLTPRFGATLALLGGSPGSPLSAAAAATAAAAAASIASLAAAPSELETSPAFSPYPKHLLVFGGADGSGYRYGGCDLVPQVITIPGGAPEVYSVEDFPLESVTEPGGGGGAATTTAAASDVGQSDPAVPFAVGRQIVELPTSAFAPGTTLHKLFVENGVRFGTGRQVASPPSPQQQQQQQPIYGGKRRRLVKGGGDGGEASESVQPPVAFLVFGGASWPPQHQQRGDATWWPRVSGDLHVLLWGPGGAVSLARQQRGVGVGAGEEAGGGVKVNAAASTQPQQQRLVPLREALGPFAPASPPGCTVAATAKRKAPVAAYGVAAAAAASGGSATEGAALPEDQWRERSKPHATFAPAAAAAPSAAAAKITTAAAATAAATGGRPKRGSGSGRNGPAASSAAVFEEDDSIHLTGDDDDDEDGGGAGGEDGQGRSRHLRQQQQPQQLPAIHRAPSVPTSRGGGGGLSGTTAGQLKSGAAAATTAAGSSPGASTSSAYAPVVDLTAHQQYAYAAAHPLQAALGGMLQSGFNGLQSSLASSLAGLESSLSMRIKAVGSTSGTAEAVAAATSASTTSALAALSQSVATLRAESAEASRAAQATILKLESTLARAMGENEAARLRHQKLESALTARVDALNAANMAQANQIVGLQSRVESLQENTGGLQRACTSAQSSLKAAQDLAASGSASFAAERTRTAALEAEVGRLKEEVARGEAERARLEGVLLEMRAGFERALGGRGGGGGAAGGGGHGLGGGR